MDDHEEVRDYLRLFFEQLELTHMSLISPKVEFCGYR